MPAQTLEHLKKLWFVSCFAYFPLTTCAGFPNRCAHQLDVDIARPFNWPIPLFFPIVCQFAPFFEIPERARFAFDAVRAMGFEREDRHRRIDGSSCTSTIGRHLVLNYHGLWVKDAFRLRPEGMKSANRPSLWTQAEEPVVG